MSRIYKVVVNIGNLTEEHLVSAGSRNVAARHIAKKMISAEVASQPDLVRLASAGHGVEDASVADQE